MTKSQRQYVHTVGRITRAGYRVMSGRYRGPVPDMPTMDVDHPGKPMIIECWQPYKCWCFRDRTRALRRAFRRFQERERVEG